MPTPQPPNPDQNQSLRIVQDALPRLEQAMRESPALRALAADLGGWLINLAAAAAHHPDAAKAETARTGAPRPETAKAAPDTKPLQATAPAGDMLPKASPEDTPATPAKPEQIAPALAATLLKRKFEPETNGGLTPRTSATESAAMAKPRAATTEQVGPSPAALAPALAQARLEARAWEVRSKHGGGLPSASQAPWPELLEQARSLGVKLHAASAEHTAFHALFVANYANLAAATELAQHVWANTSAGAAPRQHSALLLAEAHSALNALSRRAGEHWGNACSHAVHGWLSAAAQVPGVGYLRFMRLDQPASPEDHADLAERIENARREHSLPGTREAQRDSARKKAEYHGRLLAKNLKAPEQYGESERTANIAAVLRAGEQYLELGGALSNKEVRSLVSLALGALREGEERPPGCERIEEDIEREQEEQDERSAQEVLRTKRPRAAEVSRAAKLVEGRVVVLIGGDPRPSQKELLERELAPRELRWVASRPTDAASRFEPHISRKDVDLVLHVIRWTRHGHTAAVGAACRTYEKPYVRLQGGVNPSTVAHAIIEQAGERLSRPAV